MLTTEAVYRGEMKMDKILVMLTGGTICSAPNENKKRQSDAESAKSYIISDFEESDSPFAKVVTFDTVKLVPDILSENMTIASWNGLLDLLREVKWEDYKGVIILHGTDTLAFTASLLSLLLCGVPVPLCMVSAQLPLRTPDGKKEERTNGYANFRTAAELIMNGIAPNVYAVYRNMDGKMLLHYGAHLKQCPNYSNDFHSVSEIEITASSCKGKAFGTDSLYLDKLTGLKDEVMLITPYVGINYARFNIEGLSAIVHGTYHSDTVCVERKKDSEAYGRFSVLSLLERCKERDIPLFLAPCDEAAFAYDSTGDALRSGALGIARTTLETAYVKALIGVSLGYKGDALIKFLKTDINCEFVY